MAKEDTQRLHWKNEIPMYDRTRIYQRKVTLPLTCPRHTDPDAADCPLQLVSRNFGSQIGEKAEHLTRATCIKCGAAKLRFTATLEGGQIRMQVHYEREPEN